MLKNYGNVYKAYLHSTNKLSGTNSDCNFTLNIDHIVENGYCFVDSLTLTATHPSLLPVSLNEIHVKTTSLMSDRIYTSNNSSRYIISSIICNNDNIKYSESHGTTVAQLYVRYKSIGNNELNGYPVQMLNLRNFDLNIVLTNEFGIPLDPSLITSWSMCLTFVKFKTEDEQMIHPPPDPKKGNIRRVNRKKIIR